MQFSLKSMMIVTLIVAVVCAILFSFSSWFTDLMFTLVWLLIPGLLVMTIRHGNDKQRTFAVGCTATYVAIVLSGRAFASRGIIFNLLQYLFLLASGYLCLRFRSWLERHNRVQSKTIDIPTPPPLAEPTFSNKQPQSTQQEKSTP